ncbi:uncharacterized protein LOC113210127 [Frankliniella occidentalis]|uniref:Uncharacterized protein LOC113210127 n=1 Tax=Frankliniella occidentalis TaxID=133901 RepID=A0A6J1SR32_FRAOC|nr:uncharacterized protein LOC113210127 [Frankliniella occidentalis]
MPPPKDSLVLECFTFGNYPVGNDPVPKPRAECKFCRKKYAPNTTRQKQHILNECKLVPQSVKMRHSEAFSLAAVEEAVDNPGSNNVGPGVCARPASATPSASSTTGSESSRASGEPTRRSASMVRFVDQLGVTEKKTLDEALARAMYASGTPLSTFENPYWKAFFAALRPSYKLPSRTPLAKTLLDREFEKCVSSNKAKIENAQFLGIMTDSFTNIRQESVIDIVVTTPSPVLYKQIFRRTERETGEFVGDEILKVMNEIGPDKFWIFVTDNASNMQVAWEKVTEEFGHVTAIGCAAHCWNLLFKDLVEAMSVVDKYIKHSRNIVRKIKKSSNTLAVFSEKQTEKHGNKGISLKLPGKTRWAGAAILLNSLLQNKSVLQETVISEQLVDVIDAKVRRTVLDSKFWDRIKCIYDLLSPLHAAISLIESNRALLSDVYYLHKKINECVNSNIAKLRLSSSEKKEVKDILADRKGYTIAPIHMAAYLLDPRFKGEGLEDKEIADAVECISKLARHMGLDEGKVIASLAKYRTGVGFFATQSVWDSALQLHPAVWWSGVCATEPLAAVATCLLTMPPSAAEVERRWSDHGFIHNKSRNRLLNTRVTKLTTVRATLVAEKSKGKNVDPLPVAELEEYFKQYGSQYLGQAGGHGGGGGDVGETETGDGEAEEESDEESEDEDEHTDWELESDSGSGSNSEQELEEREPERRTVAPQRQPHSPVVNRTSNQDQPRSTQSQTPTPTAASTSGSQPLRRTRGATAAAVVATDSGSRQKRRKKK